MVGSAKIYFEKVKATLGKKTVLLYPIPYTETFLSTDVSNCCIAASFYQFDPSRKLRVPIIGVRKGGVSGVNPPP